MLPPEPGRQTGVPAIATTIARVTTVSSMKDNSVQPGTLPRNRASLEEARLRQQAIGVKLRHMFDEVVNEPVPDVFLEILRRADERSSGGSGE